MSEPTKMCNFRATQSEMELWADAAHLARRSRSSWMRDILNAASAGVNLDAVYPAPAPVVMPATKAKEFASALQQRAVAVKGKVRCEHRLPPGTYCKKCGVIRG